jgi:heme-degrading monooxygenase HmoA
MITLHITMQARPGRGGDVVRVFTEAYVPAIRRQKGFRRAMLLREHERRDRFGIDIYFDTEEDRLRWVASPEHVAAWPQVEAVAQQICWTGYDVLEEAGA